MSATRPILTAAAAFVAAATLASAASAAAPSPFLPKPPFAGPTQVVRFAYVVSLARSGGRWRARVDPAEFLTGATASRAAADDGAVSPGQPVPNDNYVRSEGHRLLSYLVAPGAHATVVTNSAGTGIRATPVPVAELARIVRGGNPRHRALFEPKNGFWLRIANDTVLVVRPAVHAVTAGKAAARGPVPFRACAGTTSRPSGAR
jgi:hypothetical protein